ncbi:hypothetical protein Tco_1408839 [Tanacetum coccineum]
MAAEVPQTLECMGGHLNVAPRLKEFQDSPDDEEDIKSSQEYLNDFEEEYQTRALLAKSKSEQIPTQKKRILGVDQLSEDPSSSGQKDLVFVKSLVDDTKVSVPCVERPWLSESEGFILPNHDTGRILLVESQVNTTDPPVAITDSSVTEYDSANESSVCVTINEPSSAPSKAKASALKTNSAPAGKLKNVKTEDDLPLAGVMKELNDLKLQISKNPSSYSKNNKSQQCERTDHKTCNHAEYITVHTTTDHNDIKRFRRGKALEAKKAEPLKLIKTESSYANRSKTPTKSGCSRHMIGVKSYLYKYVEQPGPKFDEKKGTIFNSNKEIVMIAPRVRDVYVLDMTSSEQASFYIHNHKDYLGKFDEKTNDGYFLGYSLVSKAFRVFNTRRQQTKETYHITFDESTNAIEFTNPSVDNISIAKSERYPPDEPEPDVLETEVSSDQNDHPAQTDEIFNDNQHNNDDPIIDNLIITEDV